MTATTNSNGRVRQTLATQIDRLDAMLDGLADGINGTVVTAVSESVGEAVRQAVQAAVSEVLINKELQRRLQPASTESSGPPANKGNRLTQAAGKACSWVGRLVKGGATKVATAARHLCQKTKKALSSVAQTTCSTVKSAYQGAKAVVTGCRRQIAKLFSSAILTRKGALIALAGIVAGAGCYVAGPLLASVIGGLYSTVLTLAATKLQPLWRLLTAYAGGNG